MCVISCFVQAESGARVLFLAGQADSLCSPEMDIRAFG